MNTFGPVPSRRLGRSLGINNIPPKHCPYSCVYCQLGRTQHLEAVPRVFYDPETLFEEVQVRIAEAGEAGESIDYLTFVPDGEPSLDIDLGKEIRKLKSTGLKIAVITNSAFIWQDRVKEDLKDADWVSLKIDSVEEKIWRKVNRPHRSLKLQKILDGIVEFAGQYTGKLMTETMLVRGLNDDESNVEKTADYISCLSPDTSYLSVPVRPPAEHRIRPPTEYALLRAHQVLDAVISNVELLIGYEGNAFASTGDAERDLLSITAVHPMREEALSEFLKRAGADRTVVDRLIDGGMLVEREYQGHRFYARKLSPARNRNMLGIRTE